MSLLGVCDPFSRQSCDCKNVCTQRLRYQKEAGLGFHNFEALVEMNIAQPDEYDCIGMTKIR